MARVKLTKQNADKKFKFGETEYESDKILELPCIIGRSKVFLRTYVLKGNIPWLIGRVTMQKLGAIVDFENNKVVFRDINEVVKLREDSGGHLRMSVGRKVTKEEVWGEGFGDMVRSERLKKIKKLHFQFGHPGAEGLIRLLAEAKGDEEGNSNEWKAVREDVMSITKDCDTCIKYSKVPPRPVVGLALSKKFNDVIALDLGEFKSKRFMVMVDLKTKYCQACWMGSKKPEEVIKKLIKHWIGIFGSPNSILTDNGREFSNEKFLEMTEVFSIKSMTTAAESPWSNGVCEKTVGLIKDSMRKMMEDGDKDLETILYWTVAARNTLFNKNGFSPNQLVFGRNPNLPGSNDKENPAGLRDRDDEEDYIRENLLAMQNSRRIHIMQESDQKIRLALKKQIREHRIEDAQQGDEVFYKREGEKSWRGPAKVVGVDGKTVIVKHGGDLKEICRVHITRLRGIGASLPKNEVNQVKEGNKVGGTKTGSGDRRVLREEQSEEDSDSEYEVGIARDEGEQNDEVAELEDEIETAVDAEVLPVQRSPIERRDQGPREQGQEESSEGLRTEDTREEAEQVGRPIVRFETDAVREIIPRLRKGQRIRAADKKSGDEQEFKIFSLAGKRNTKWGDSYNIIDREGEKKWIDLREYQNIRQLDEKEEDFLGEEIEKVVEAKANEFYSWKENEVYEEVEDLGQKTVALRWVITNKVKDGKAVCKARLVAKGFQEKDVGEKEAPTCAAEAFRICLAMMLMKGWEAKSIDVKTAYLQGENIRREVFVKPPVEAKTNKLWKLRKTIYGLKDAARAWYEKVIAVMGELGGEKSSFEPTIFIWKKDNGEVRGMVCIHVDDFLFGGDESFEGVIIRLKGLLKVGEVQCGKFSYVGVGVQQTKNEIFLDQDKYTKKLEVPDINDFESDREMDEREMAIYRGLVGKLNWLVQHTRPDISFDVSRAGKSFQQGNCLDMRDLIKRTKNAKETPGRVRMNKLYESEVYWEVFCDAAYANIEGMSQIGFTVALKDDMGKICPIHWKSTRAKRIARSSTEAEALSLAEAAEMVKYLSALWNEIGGGIRPVIIKTDNRNLYLALKSKVAVKSRGLRIDMAAIQEIIKKGDMFVSWVSGGDQLADVLTKDGIRKNKLRNYMFGPKEKQVGGLE